MGKCGELGGCGSAVWVRWLLSGPVNFRCGADRLQVHLRDVLGLMPLARYQFESLNSPADHPATPASMRSRAIVWSTQKRKIAGNKVCPPGGPQPGSCAKTTSQS